MALKLLAEIADGINPKDERRAHKAELTFKDLFAEYMTRHAKIHKKTADEDQEKFDNHLQSLIRRKLSSITQADIEAVFHKIGSNHRTTANRVLSLLHTVFEKGIAWGYCKVNSAHGIKRYKEKSRDRFLKVDELPRFFEALDAEPSELLRDYFMLALLTGARRDNLCSMAWDNIDFNQAQWYIPDTKNGTPQTVELAPEAVEILERRKKLSNSKFVFPSTGKRGHMVEPRKGWQRICAHAGIIGLRIHDLRRTFGSYQAINGSSLPIIGKSLNHKSINTTAIYARMDKDPVRKSVNGAVDTILKAGKRKPSS
jgi:integrase